MKRTSRSGGTRRSSRSPSDRRPGRLVWAPRCAAWRAGSGVANARHLTAQSRPWNAQHNLTTGVGKHGVIPHELQWARLRLDVNRGLRRGAWYRVIRITDEGVMLDVNRTPVTLARTLLETVTVPPRRWSVVLRPRDAVCLPRDWGDRYLTCPGCRNRAPTRGHPPTLGCPRCGARDAGG